MAFADGLSAWFQGKHTANADAAGSLFTEFIILSLDKLTQKK